MSLFLFFFLCFFSFFFITTCHSFSSYVSRETEQPQEASNLCNDENPISHCNPATKQKMMELNYCRIYGDFWRDGGEIDGEIKLAKSAFGGFFKGKGSLSIFENKKPKRCLREPNLVKHVLIYN